MNSVSFTIKSRTTQIRHASPNPLFFRTLHIQLPKASPSSCSFPVTPPQSISTQAKVHHQQSLPWLLQFQSRRDGTRSRTWTFAPSSSHCKGIGKRQRLFLSWQARAGLPLLSLGAQGWLEAEEKRNPSPGCTQMETLHIVHFLTPAETGWPLPRNHASGQRGFPQEPTNKPEKKRKKKRVVHTKSSQRQQTCLEKTALIPPLSTSHHFLRTSETATLFFALPSDDALSLSSSQLNPTPRSALSPPCYPFPSPSNLSRYLHCRIGSWMTSPKPARQI